MRKLMLPALLLAMACSPKQNSLEGKWKFDHVEPRKDEPVSPGMERSLEGSVMTIGKDGSFAVDSKTVTVKGTYTLNGDKIYITEEGKPMETLRYKLGTDGSLHLQADGPAIVYTR